MIFLVIYLTIISIIIIKSLYKSMSFIKAHSVQKKFEFLLTFIQIESIPFLNFWKINLFSFLFIILIIIFLNITGLLNALINSTAYCMDNYDFQNLESTDLDINTINDSTSSSYQSSLSDEEYMSSVEVDNFIATYSFEVENLLKINRYFYNLHMSSSYIRVNPVFFQDIAFNLILESNEIQINILRALNFININNINRDDMVVYKNEYLEIFQIIDDNITEIKKTTNLSMESYLFTINNPNPNIQILSNFLPNYLDELSSIHNIFSFTVDNNISNNYFQYMKELVIFLDQTTDLITLNMQLINMLEVGSIIDHNIGLDFNPRNHPRNTELINANTLNDLINFYRPIVNPIDIENVYRRPPFDTDALINRGFIII